MDEKKHSQKDNHSHLKLESIQLTLFGNQKALIENYRGILEYDTTLLIVQSKQEQLIINGTHLNIMYYTCNEMCVCGNIEKIEIKAMSY